MASSTFYDYLPAFMLNERGTDFSAEGILVILLLVAFSLIGIGYYLNKKLDD